MMPGICTQGSFTCRKSTTWDRWFYFPSEGRRAEDFYRPLKIRRLRPGLNPRSLVSEATTLPLYHRSRYDFWLNPLNAELNPIFHLLALLGGATIVVVSRLRVNLCNWRPLCLFKCYVPENPVYVYVLRKTFFIMHFLNFTLRYWTTAWIFRGSLFYFGVPGFIVVKALRYKPAGRGFDSRWCHWNFSVT
jgi:hypothetical protein